jgi:aspartyl protease family protein
MRGEARAGFPADMHVVLFAVLCVLSAACGGLLAFFADVILVGAYGTAGNFATPAIFLILLLVGFVSPPAVLLWTRRQAQRDHARLQIKEPVLTGRPEAAPEEKDPSKEKGQREPQAEPQTKEHEPQGQSPLQGGTPSTAGPEAALPGDRPPATLGPIIVEPVYVAQARKSGSGILVATAVVLAAFAGGLLLGGKHGFPLPEDIKAEAMDRLHDLAHAIGIDIGDEAPVSDSGFSALYNRLGIAPLPARLEREATINRGLSRLRQEGCDKEAVFSVGEALQKGGDRRIAANVYLGFAAVCGNGEGEKYAAANILYQLADYDPVIMIMTEMIAAKPATADYRYLRGAALLGAKRYDEALADYANAIELYSNRRIIGEWVFLEMSGAYASLKQYCAAITPIQTWVAIDPPSRDTARTRRLILDYSKQGDCDLHYATGTDTFPHDSSNVIRARVSVNGVEGTFVVDTGASFMVVTVDFATRAKVDVTRQSVPIDTANGRAESTLGRAASVRIGRRVEAADVPILIQNRSMGRDVDGLLGMSFLSRFDLSIGRRDWTLSSKK